MIESVQIVEAPKSFQPRFGSEDWVEDKDLECRDCGGCVYINMFDGHAYSCPKCRKTLIGKDGDLNVGLRAKPRPFGS